MPAVGGDDVPDPAPPRAARYGAFPLVALAATTALETGERSSLSQAADGIQRAFHVSDRAIGFLPFAMSFVGVPLEVPAPPVDVAPVWSESEVAGRSGGLVQAQMQVSEIQIVRIESLRVSRRIANDGPHMNRYERL